MGAAARHLALALLASLGFLLAPATASAGWKVDRAQKVAMAAWNDPCDGPVGVRFRPTDNPSWAAQAALGACEPIIFDPTERWTWPILCTTMIHEYGHITGRMHSRDPYNVMYPEPAWDVELDGVQAETLTIRGKVYRARHPGGDPRCVHHGRPFLASKGVDF